MKQIQDRDPYSMITLGSDTKRKAFVHLNDAKKALGTDDHPAHMSLDALGGLLGGIPVQVEDESVSGNLDLTSPGEVDRKPNVGPAIRQTSIADKSASSCPHGVTTRKRDGSIFCHGCKRTWVSQTDFEHSKNPPGADKTNSSQDLFKSTKRNAENALRDEISAVLYAIAAKTADLVKKAKLEKAAYEIDAGMAPIPHDLIAKTGPVRLSTGLRKTHKHRYETQGQRFARVHGFGE